MDTGASLLLPEVPCNQGSTSQHSTRWNGALKPEGPSEVRLPALELPEELFSFQELKLCKVYETRLLQDPSVHSLKERQVSDPYSETSTEISSTAHDTNQGNFRHTPLSPRCLFLKAPHSLSLWISRRNTPLLPAPQSNF